MIYKKYLLNNLLFPLFILFLFSEKPLFAGHGDGFPQLSPAGYQDQNPIAQEAFPNFFAPLPPHTAADIESAINRALDSIITRLDIPYENHGKIQTSGFANHLLAKVKDKSVDPGAKVYLSGGVVRSLLGYLYQHVYNAKLKNSKRDTLDILNSLALEKDKVPFKPIQAFRALGIGSDMDVLVTPSSQEQAHSVKETASKVVNSARVHLHLENNNDPLVTSMVPIGDVNLYSNQMARSMENGGSTLDYLAFDLENHQIKMPEKYPYILSQFIHGQYDYVKGEKREDTETTTIRGLRPRVEIPFLHLTEEGQSLVQKELTEIESRIASGKSLSDRAMIQFDKLARNARMGGGKNRIFESNDPIDVLAKSIVMKIGTRGKEVYVVPKFIRHDHLKYRKTREVPKELLMNLEDFEANFTTNGLLFHGTPEINNLLKMVRNGMILSINSEGFTQGNASFGPGAYTTKDYKVAAGYVKTKGAVIPIELKKNLPSPPKIIDWKKVENTDFIKEVENFANAQKPKMHVFDVLARDYGIDIIIKEHVLIQNSTLLKLPKYLRDLIQFQTSTLESGFVIDPKLQRNLSTQNSFGDQWETYQEIRALATALGQPDLTPPENILLRAMERTNPQLVEKATGKSNGNTLTDLPQLMEEILTHFDPKYKNSLYFLKYVPPKNQYSLWSKALQLNDRDSRIIASHYLKNYADPHTAFAVFDKAMSDTDKALVKNAITALSNYPGEKAYELFHKAFEYARTEEARKLSVPYYNPFIDFEGVGRALVKYQGPDARKVFHTFLQSTDSKIKEIIATNALSYTGIDSLELFKEMIHMNDQNIKQGIKNVLIPLSNHFSSAIPPGAIKNNLQNYPGTVFSTHGKEVFDLLFSQEDHQLRKSAVNSLYLYSALDPHFSPEIYESCLDRAFSDSDVQVRRAATTQLFAYQGKNLKKYIAQASNDKKPIRDEVAAFLNSNVETPEKEEIIKDFLDHRPASDITAGILPFYKGADLSHYIARFLMNPSTYPPELREAAALGLYTLKSTDKEDIGPLILQALHDPERTVRKAATFVFNHYHGPHLDRIISKGLEDPDASIQWEAVRTLSMYRGDKAEELFIKAITSFNNLDYNNPNDITYNLGMYATSQKSNALIKKLLQNPNPAVRSSACLSIMAYSGHDANDLIESAVNSEDPKIAANAMQHILLYEGMNVEPLLEKILNHSELNLADRAGVYFSTYIAKYKNHALFLKMVHHSNPIIRVNAIRAMKNYRFDNHELIVELLNSKDENVRTAAASVLSSYNGKKSKQVFALALGDSKESVRQKATKELLSYSGKDKKKLILNLLKTENPNVIVGALDGFKNTIDILLSQPFYRDSNTDELCDLILHYYYETEDPAIRQAARDSAFVCRGEKAFNFYATLLKDRDSSIRKKAALSLSYYQGSKLKDLLSIAIVDSHKSVRRNVYHVLSDPQLLLLHNHKINLNDLYQSASKRGRAVLLLASQHWPESKLLKEAKETLKDEKSPLSIEFSKLEKSLQKNLNNITKINKGADEICK